MTPAGEEAEEAEPDHSLDGGLVDAGTDAGGVVKVDQGSLQARELADRNSLVIAGPGSGTGRTAERKGRCSPWAWWDHLEG
jgi:hypothetical protein